MFLLQTQRAELPSRLVAATGGALTRASVRSEARSAGAGSHAEQNQRAPLVRLRLAGAVPASRG